MNDRFIIEILPAKKRGFFLKKNGKSLVSEFDPVLEGERIADLYKDFKKTTFLVFLGILPLYHIEFLVRKVTQECLVWIFEEDACIQKAFQAVIQKNKKLFPFVLQRIQEKNIIFNDIDNLVSSLEGLDLKNFPKPLIIKGKKKSSEYQYVLNKINFWIKQRNTERYFIKIWDKNTSFNIKQEKKLLGEWEPPPKSSVAVLVSTGPSLEKEIGNLIDCKKELQEKLCIVAAPGAVEFLNFFKILPDCIISTDGGFSNDCHFRYLSRINFPPPLVAPYSIQKNIIKNYGGEVFFFLTTLAG